MNVHILKKTMKLKEAMEARNSRNSTRNWCHITICPTWPPMRCPIIHTWQFLPQSAGWRPAVLWRWETLWEHRCAVCCQKTDCWVSPVLSVDPRVQFPSWTDPAWPGQSERHKQLVSSENVERILSRNLLNQASKLMLNPFNIKKVASTDTTNVKQSFEIK